MHSNGMEILLVFKEIPMTEVIEEGSMCKFSQHQDLVIVICSVVL